jgi:hypothetical protein
VDNIKQNNLSLKSLKAELEAVKSPSAFGLRTNNHPLPKGGQGQPTISSQTITTDGNGKQSVVTRFVMKSGMPLFWIVSTLLTYGHKIPIISKIIKGLSLWYGRTTWWKILVQMRKVFIIFNALIGVYTVFKVTGFSTDNLFAGFYGVGYTYVEMLTSFTKRLFNWFVELFDYKVVPNVPNNPTNPSWKPWTSNNTSWKWWGPKENTWYTRPMHGNEPFGNVFDLAKSQDFYRSPSNLSTSTSTDWNLSTWLWYGGITILTVGVLFLGYKLVMDPSWFFPSDVKQNTPMQPTSPVAPNPPVVPGEGVADLNNIPDSRTDTGSNAVTGAFTYLTNKVVQFNKAVINTLNPMNYIKTTSTNTNNQLSYDDFLNRQFDMVRADRTLYPFTNINPYDTWAQKLKLSLFGESTFDSIQRFKHRLYANRDLDLIRVNRELLSGINTPTGSGSITPTLRDVWGSGTVTPKGITTVGLNLTNDLDSNSFLNTLKSASKLNNISPTPTYNPLFDTTYTWKDHVKAVLVEPSSIASSSNVTLEDLPAPAPAPTPTPAPSIVVTSADTVSPTSTSLIENVTNASYLPSPQVSFGGVGENKEGLLVPSENRFEILKEEKI